MISIRTIILLLGLIAIALACAPHHAPKHHGHCKYYVDGSTDDTEEDKARDKKSTGSGSDSSGESGEKKSDKSGESVTTSKKSSDSTTKAPAGKFNRSKKKKDVKCYKYEDGTKDDGAVLKEGVIDITITKKSS